MEPRMDYFLVITLNGCDPEILPQRYKTTEEVVKKIKRLLRDEEFNPDRDFIQLLSIRKNTPSLTCYSRGYIDGLYNEVVDENVLTRP